MENKKYRLTDETINFLGKTLYRIESLKDFGDVEKGDLGGFVESEKKLSHEDNAMVYNNAKVFGGAMVYGNAKVFGNAHVRGDAKVCNAYVYDNAKVFDNAWIYIGASVFGGAMVYDNAKVFGNAEICGDAVVESDNDYIVFKNHWSSGRYFTYTKSNKMWKVGCFYGTGDELIEKAYKDSKHSGIHYEKYEKYEKYVNFVRELEEFESIEEVKDGK